MMASMSLEVSRSDFSLKEDISIDGKCLIHLLLKKFSTAFISAWFKSFMANKKRLPLAAQILSLRR